MIDGYPEFIDASHARTRTDTGIRLSTPMPVDVTAPAPRATSIAAVDHPSYGDAIDRFLDELRAERRCFGPTARTNPKPFPSLIDALAGRGGFRLAAWERGRIVGMCRIDGAGEFHVAVVADHRRAGIGRALAHAALSRAADLHYPVVRARSTRRSVAMQRLCEEFGCAVIEFERGRVELILTPLARTA
jgi:GNAT superfamily N-acetyltransferase